MLVWIVRHGKAESGSRSGKDEDRQLASRGELQAEWLGEQIARHKHKPASVVTSPIVRAVETARLINQSLNVSLRASPLLKTGVPASSPAEVIAAHDGKAPLMIVGHNPTLAQLIGVFTQGIGAEAELRTGQAVLLDCDPSRPIGSATVLDELRMDGED